MNDRVPNALVGIAGVHYVAAELSLRGLVALPTVRNTAGYDIIVTTSDGKRHANIQVKTSQKRVKFWPMPLPEEVHTNATDFYVLIRRADEKFEAFLLSGKDTANAVRDVVRRQRQSIKRGTRKKIFPCIEIGGESEKWKRMWAEWKC